MPANTSALQLLTPNAKSFVTSGTANTTYANSPTGSSTTAGNAAGTNGDRLDSVSWVVGTPNASGGKVQFWKYDGSTYFFWDEMSYVAGSASATVVAQKGTWVPPGGQAFLPSTWKVAVSCSQTDTVACHVEQGSY